jgi:hypothetical protein
MGKNRSASGLTNVIQYDNNGNIAFVSGSTTLMQVSSSGAITTTGTISGGAAADALLLNGTGSLAFVTTASYNVASSSFSSRTTQVERTYATTGSNTFTGAQFASDTSNAISFTSTASLYSDGGLRVQGNSFVSGTAYFNNIVVYGTSSIQYITSSQVNVGTNIITVNTDTPAVRFGGLAVFDSGSTQLTGSILWDSEKNHWVYSNPSGSSYSGGMLISGPRSSALGSEQGTTSCMLLVGQGGDHLTSSLVYHDSTRTCFYGTSLIVSSSGNVGIGVSQPSSPLSIGGTYSTTTPLICITGTGTGVYQRVITALNPGMSAGDDLMIQMGTALTYRNAGQISFHNEGSGCASNRVSIGFYQEDDIFSVSANRYVGIGSCAPAVVLDVQQSCSTNMGIWFTNTCGAAGSTSQTVDLYSKLVGPGLTGQVGSLIRTGKEADYSSGGARDAYLSVQVAQDDALVERLRIASTGNTTFACKIGVAGASATYPLTVYNGSNGTTAALGGTVYGIRIDNGGTFSSGRSTIYGVDASFYGSYQPLSLGGSELYFNISGTDKVSINSSNLVVQGSGLGLQFTGGNNRIYFGACRAIEGSTSGTTLQIGEYYDKTQIQSSAMMYNGSGGNSPKLYFGGEGNETAGAKAIYLETFWMIIQPHVNEGLRIRAVNGSGSQSTIAKFYGTGTFSLDQYSNGTLSVSGGVVVSSSDKCMKIDDGGIDIALPKIMCLNPRYFYWKPETCLNSCDRQLGFYAQDVSEILGTEVANQSHNCSWGIYDRGIIAMLTKGMQEQQCKIALLESCLGIS